jgi:ferredoxin-type protein NapH
MKTAKLSNINLIVQAIATLAVNSYIVGWFVKPHLYTDKLKGIILPILNCYACPGAVVSCPAGSIQHFAVINAFPYFTIGVLVLFGAFVGRLLCGWACPFGFFQDLLSKIPTPKLRLPKFFIYLKYIFLFTTVFGIPLIISDTVFCKICPQGALEGGIPQMLLNFTELNHLAGTLYFTKLAILIAVIVAALLIKRFFCRAICPVGAFMALFNKTSLLQITVDSDACKSCDLCKKVCPVDIQIYDDPTSAECIRCGRCSTTCTKGAVRFSTLFSKSKAKNFV